MAHTTATDSFAYDFNAGAQEHDEQQLADYEAAFQKEFAHLSSNLLRQVKVIRSDDTLSFDEKVARLRALRVVNNADFDQMRQAATAIEQQQQLTLEASTPVSTTPPPVPSVSGAEQARLIQMEEQLQKGLKSLTDKVGGQIIQQDGQIDIEATLAQLSKNFDKKLDEKNTVTLPTGMLSKEDVREKFEKVNDILTQKADVKSVVVGKHVVIDKDVYNDELLPALQEGRKLYHKPTDATS